MEIARANASGLIEASYRKTVLVVWIL